MATREENLKKINAELEQLSDEELEQVAGGTWAQTGNDRKFFNKLDVNKKSVGDCWSEFGFAFKSQADNNVYKLGDKNYSQAGAYGVILSKMKYSGFVGDGSDENYTKDFVKKNFGLDL